MDIAEQPAVETETPAEPDRRELLEQQFDDAAPVEGRTRDEKGRYSPNSPEKLVETPEITPVEAPAWSKPPASWKKENHALWSAADPKMQEYAWQREEQMRAGVEPMIAKAQFADQMQQVMQPYMQTIQGLGIQPHQAVQALMKADHTLRNSSPQERLAYFNNLAQQYGVNLGDIGSLPAQQPVDPTVYALHNELNRVRGEVASWKEQQEQSHNQVLLGEIKGFADKNEHFEAARPVMVQLLQSGMAANLQEAYEKAIRLDPELSATLQQAAQAQVDQGRRTQADKAAKAAKAAAVSVRSSTPGTHSASKAQDRRSMLMDQFDGLSERL